MEVKILVIEDDLLTRNNLKLLLEKNGYEVYEADNGKKGFELANSIKPDLILCDIIMPVMDGHKVIERLQSSDETFNIPFIFLTSKNSFTEIREGMNLGADDYLQKPFVNEELLNAISARLKKRRKSIPEEPSETDFQKLSENDGIILNVGNDIIFVRVKEIIVIKSASQYTDVFLENGKKSTVRKSMSEWEKQLPEDLFMRIHRSSIINLTHIKKIEKWHQQTLRVHLNGHEEPLTISSSYASQLKSKI